MCSNLLQLIFLVFLLMMYLLYHVKRIENIWFTKLLTKFLLNTMELYSMDAVFCTHHFLVNHSAGE